MQVSVPVTSVGGWLCVYQLWEKYAALRHSCNLAGLCPWCSLPRLCLFCVTFGACKMLRMCPQVAIELQWAVSLCQQASALGASRGCHASSVCEISLESYWGVTKSDFPFSEMPASQKEGVVSPTAQFIKVSWVSGCWFTWAKHRPVA